MRALRRALSAGVLLLLLAGVYPMQAQGIDVSKFQGKVNWTKVAKSGKVKFVYIRATEGTSIKDPYYKTNLEKARKAGLKVGSYHVYSSKTTAQSQFANFKSMVPKKNQDLIPVLDIEGHHSGRLYMARVDMLLNLMEKEYGAKPMIYTSEKVYKEHFTGKKYAKYHIFVAKYKGTPAIRYTLWQHSKSGYVSGISGHVDLDKFHPKHSLNDLYLPGRRPKPKPKPKSAADSTANTTAKTATADSTAKTTTPIKST